MRFTLAKGSNQIWDGIIVCRGYDDVDPDRVQFIEQMLRDMMDEIKQRELDIAAGAIPTTDTPATPNVEQDRETRAQDVGGFVTWDVLELDSSSSSSFSGEKISVFSSEKRQRDKRT